MQKLSLHWSSLKKAGVFDFENKEISRWYTKDILKIRLKIIW